MEGGGTYLHEERWRVPVPAAEQHGLGVHPRRPGHGPDYRVRENAGGEVEAGVEGMLLHELLVLVLHERAYDHL